MVGARGGAGDRVRPGAADRQTGKQSLNVEMTGSQQPAAKPLPAVVGPSRLACYTAEQVFSQMLIIQGSWQVETQ